MGNLSASSKLILLFLCALVGAFGPLGSGILSLLLSIAAHSLEKRRFLHSLTSNSLLLLFCAMPAVFFLLLGMPNWLPTGINSFLYLCGMLTLASLFSSTTSVAEAAETISRLGVKKETAIAFPLALQSAKTFGTKLQTVRKTQAARGGGGIIPTLVPLFHSVFRRARTLANSFESRGFSSE